MACAHVFGLQMLELRVDVEAIAGLPGERDTHI